MWVQLEKIEQLVFCLYFRDELATCLGCSLPMPSPNVSGEAPADPEFRQKPVLKKDAIVQSLANDWKQHIHVLAENMHIDGMYALI